MKEQDTSHSSKLKNVKVIPLNRNDGEEENSVLSFVVDKMLQDPTGVAVKSRKLTDDKVVAAENKHNLQNYNDNGQLPNYKNQYTETEKNFKHETKNSELELVWRDITITAITSSKGCCKKTEIQEKVILHSLNGRVRTGECLAIIGSSGAGKTTLLNFLSRKIATENLKNSGEVLLNGQEIVTDKFNTISAYVMQDDILEPLMTPTEILFFTARLKLDLPDDEIEMKVKKMIDDLHLNRCKNTRIGNAITRGVSGGERKRTSIGVELMSNPKIVFLDEPTTGLDSYNAFEVLALLKKLAKEGRIIIYTIHQPSSELFNLLDKLNILALGRTVYYGPAEKSFLCFERYKLPVPLNYNPFEHFMETTTATAVENPKIREQYPELDKFEDRQKKYEEYVSILNKNYQEHIDDYEYKAPFIAGFDEDNKKMFEEKDFRQGFFYEFALLLGRTMMIASRNSEVIAARFGQVIFTAALVSALFVRVRLNTKSIIDNEKFVRYSGYFRVYFTYS